MLRPFFEQEKIEYYALLSISDVKIWDERKFFRMEEEIGKVKSVAVFLIPYFAGQKTTNLSIYAQPRDYHLYLKELSLRLEEYRKKIGAEFSFRGFADSSPLAERDAALSAGLGVMGKNGLLIHPEYGSFFFIGAFFFTEIVMEPTVKKVHQGCMDCGSCERACPTGAILDPERKMCLSLISQKKNLTEEEAALLAKAECKWGCDLCQIACPMNHNVALTPIPFFQRDHISSLSSRVIEMPKGEFLSRAFSWRGREILRRNIGENKKREVKGDFSDK